MKQVIKLGLLLSQYWFGHHQKILMTVRLKPPQRKFTMTIEDLFQDSPISRIEKFKEGGNLEESFLWQELPPCFSWLPCPTKRRGLWGCCLLHLKPGERDFYVLSVALTCVLRSWVTLRTDDYSPQEKLNEIVKFQLLTMMAQLTLKKLPLG